MFLRLTRDRRFVQPSRISGTASVARAFDCGIGSMLSGSAIARFAALLLPAVCRRLRGARLDAFDAVAAFCVVLAERTDDSQFVVTIFAALRYARNKLRLRPASRSSATSRCCDPCCSVHDRSRLRSSSTPDRQPDQQLGIVGHIDPLLFPSPASPGAVLLAASLLAAHQ